MLSGIPEDVLPLFLNSSTDWQKILDVVPGGLRLKYRDARGVCFAQLARQGIIQAPHGQRGNQMELDMEKLTSMIVERLKSELCAGMLMGSGVLSASDKE
jgi:hypothetical protein